MDFISEELDHDGGVFVSPSNFSAVEDGIFRSALPQPHNFSYLETLKLRSIIYMCPGPYPEENWEFVRSQNIQLFQFAIEGTKDPALGIPRNTIIAALKILVDVRNHPILIHCKQGKHRTGCVVGCLRKLQNWCLPAVLEEYKKFAGVKSRITDMKFIETYDIVWMRQCLYSIIYQYHGYGSNKRRLLYEEDNIKKPRITSS